MTELAVVAAVVSDDADDADDDDDDDKQHNITANFTSFEDFIARMILVPQDDDLCTGAKVGGQSSSSSSSHHHDYDTVVIIDNDASVKEKEEGANCDNNEEGKMIVAEDGLLDDERSSASNTSNSQQQQVDENNDNKENNVVCGATATTTTDDDGSYYIGTIVADKDQQHQHLQQQQVEVEVPMGYILIKIITSHDNNDNYGNNNNTSNNDVDIPNDLANIEFTELFSFLRCATFPLSLVFAPSPLIENSIDHNDEDDNDDDEDCNNNNDNIVVNVNEKEEEKQFNSVTNTNTISSKIINEISSISREDASKYAKQAATELRGRLSRWGYQAALIAVDAATQVKEMRDDDNKQQCMMTDDNEEHPQPQQQQEQQHRSSNIDDESELTTTYDCTEVSEKKKEDSVGCSIAEEKIDVCSMFIQTPAGFELLQYDTMPSLSITSNSVISVRLSNDRACPVGGNGNYTFQWYRSNNKIDGVIIKLLPSNDETNKSDKGWSILRGACYAAYQPSVSDVGRKLVCIIKHNDIYLQSCYIPGIVVLEQSILDSAKKNLLGGQRSISFENLQGLDDQSQFRLKIELVSNDDFISSSSIYISRMTGGGVNEQYYEKEEAISHFKAEADPAKPRLLDLTTCSSHGRLRLDTTNRKSRESLLLALGLASYKGKLSTLTTETALFPSFESEDVLPLNNHSPLEAKIAQLNRLLELKDDAITRLQLESIESNATKLYMETELQSCREAERNLMSALQISESTITEQARANAALVAGQERTVKALLNEKAVQQAAIDARDGKIVTLSNQLSELTKRTSLQSDQLSSIESLKNDLIKAQEQCSSAEAVIVKMKEKESELIVDLAKAISKSAQLEADIEKKDAVHRVSTVDISKYESENRRLKIERNSLRQRVEGLSKEMSKTNSKSLECEKLKSIIQELRCDNRNLLVQIEVVKSEKRDTVARLEATYAAHEQSVRYQRSSSTPTKADNSSCLLEERVSELESVIASMTEYLSAKDQQISTLKQINEAILNDHR